MASGRHSLVCIGVTALAFLAPVTRAQEAEPSPLARAKVGDWVEFEAAMPSLGMPFPGGAKASPMLTVRYTVAARDGNKVTLQVKSWAGDREGAERAITVDTDGPFEPGRLTPAASKDAPAMTLEKKAAQSFTINKQTFDCTAYIYSMPFLSLPGLPAMKADAKAPPRVRVGFLASPKAPVLGLVAISIDMGYRVVYRLKGGTGVDDLLYPPVNPRPVKVAKSQEVGAWAEYRGENKSDKRPVTLRHTVLGVSAAGTKLRVEMVLGADEPLVAEATLAADGSTSQLVLLPPIPALGFRPDPSVAPSRTVGAQVDLPDGRHVGGKRRSYLASLEPRDGKKPRFSVTFEQVEDFPPTGVAGIFISSTPLNTRLVCVGGSHISTAPAPAAAPKEPASPKAKARTGTKARRP